MIKRLIGAVLIAVMVNTAFAYSTEEDKRNKEQARLDGICETARQQALEPKRQEIFDECLEKFKKDEATCTAEAGAYNGYRVGGAPLHYDLPECEEAFSFKKSSK